MSTTKKVLIGIGCVILIAGGIGTLLEGDDPKPESTAVNPDPAEIEAPKVTGTCPGPMRIGQPVTLHMKVTNPGPAPYPATFLGFWNGSGPFVVNHASSDGAPAAPGNYGLQDKGLQFRGYLDSGESRQLSVTITPKDPGNFDELKWAVWGGNENGPAIPPSHKYFLSSCENITINP